MACCFCLLSAAALASDWAVRVEGGAGVSDADADAMAEEMGLVNAGEAIPGSGIFHFRLPRRARARRDASVLSARATEALSAHPSVAEVEHQSTPLVRVRRVPVPVPFPVPQSPPPPPSSSPAELCFLNTEATAEREALRCVFPFRYKGRTYLECTADHSVNGKQWCATEVSYVNAKRIIYVVCDANKGILCFVSSVPFQFMLPCRSPFLLKVVMQEKSEAL